MDTYRHASPFVPGTGKVPPLLAGREPHKQRLCRLTAYLLDGQGAPRPAVLTGPRGNGKTALMGWLEGHAEELGLDTLWLTPADIPDMQSLVAALQRPPAKRVSQVEFKGGIGGTEAGVAARFADRARSSAEQVTAALTRKARNRPFVLLLDEAHTLDRETGRILLNAAQKTARTAPFLLAMAGTPDLSDALDGMNATFWDRASKVGVGLLSEEEALEAIEIPLRDRGIALQDPKQWEDIARDASGYPHFVQLWGDALWDRSEETGRNQLTAGDVERAGSAVAAERLHYFGLRRKELRRAGLLDAAAAVAEAFAEPPGAADVSDKELCGLVEGAGADRPLEAVTGLAHSGFVWQEPPRPGDPSERSEQWSPGIPSMMRYVLDQARNEAIANQPQ